MIKKKNLRSNEEDHTTKVGGIRKNYMIKDLKEEDTKSRKYRQDFKEEDMTYIDNGHNVKIPICPDCIKEGKPFEFGESEKGYYHCKNLYKNKSGEYSQCWQVFKEDTKSKFKPLEKIKVQKTTEYLLAGDLKELVANNPDYYFDSDKVLLEAYKLNDDQLIKVVQEIGSKIKIKSVKKITEENIEESDSEVKK